MNPLKQKTMRSDVPSDTVEVRPVYILVMGLTGAGKSTFISVITGNDKIPVGDAGTMEGGMLAPHLDDFPLVSLRS